MKFERLALPIGHDRKPFAPAQPNYGRLLDFTEEEKHARDTREHRLYTPYVPPKDKPNHTIPLRNPQIERLARPKHPQEPRQLPQGQLKAPAQNGGRGVTSTAFVRSVSLKADLPQRVDPSSKTRSHSMGKSLSSSQTKSLSDQSNKSSFLKRQRRQAQDLNQIAASYKGDRPNHIYGGTTLISYTPSALTQARERCMSIGVSKIEWKSLEPLRRTESMHPSRPQCEKITVPRSVSACPPLSRPNTDAAESPKVQTVVSQAVPKKLPDTMPKPPMQLLCGGIKSRLMGHKVSHPVPLAKFNASITNVDYDASKNGAADQNSISENKRISKNISTTRLPELNAKWQAVSATDSTNTIQTFRKGSAISSPQLPGKTKYIIEYGVLAMYDTNNSTGSHGMLFLFCELETGETVFSYREGATGNVYARSFTDEELEIEKNASGVAFSWAPFFKSVAAALIKSTAVVSAVSETQKDVSFTICNSKDTARSYPFKVSMGLVSNGRSPSMEVVFRYVLRPLSRGLQYYGRMDNKRMLQTQRIECETVVNKASLDRLKKDADHLSSAIYPLCEDLASTVYEFMKLSNELRLCEAQVRELKGKNGVTKHPLDALYDDGGPQKFEHISWSVQHYPYETEVDDILLDCIRAAFPLPPEETLDSISRVLELPDIKQRIDSSGNHQTIVEVLEVFKGIDQWGCDTIGLEILTEGNSLFYLVYFLMYKLDLVSHFNINDQILRNFLAAVQAGYHANPYHNAMHAADVTQINYYIMMVAGLCDKCCLTRIEIFAGLISGAIHDFDHPGLNNNFHTRTNAHLAILYNDRSILENHHVACIFELLRNPRYDILATLDEQQKKDFRSVVLEMVLATDMGNHAKIFKKFQVRVSEPEDWHSKKDDVMLALCMSIKTADVSNCARPSHIYTVWARNIANEFYLQGDAERSLDFPITPFMDRTKDKGEFVKGQIAFIMFIVRPLVEAISELLPSLSFMVGFCNENMHLLKARNERPHI